jgi:transposase
VTDRSTQVERHVPGEELRRRLARAEDSFVRRRLAFVLYLYDGRSIASAARAVGASATVGSRWLVRWNRAAIGSIDPSGDAESDHGTEGLSNGQRRSIERRLRADGHL